MGTIGKDFKYKIIKDFLSKDEIDLLTIFCDMKHRTKLTNFDFSLNNNADTMYYGEPIFDSLMLKKQQLMEKETGKKLNLEPGDAAIYLGCEVEHWREEFKGDYQFQTFLHYVDAEGKNKEHYMDKRKYWGCDK